MADLTTSANVDTLMQAASFAAFRTSLGTGTGDSPQFTGINVGDAADTTITRVSAGVLAVEGATLSTLSAAETLTGVKTFTPTARASGVAAYLTVTMPSDTGQTVSTESIGENHTAGTRTWAAGALTTQRERVFGAPTIAFASASTVTTAINVDIADPVAGSNATLTAKWALQAASLNVTGNANLGGTTTAGTINATTLTSTQLDISQPASDGLATGIVCNDFNSGYSSSAVGDLVYLDSSATWQKTDANATATFAGLLGIALEVKASGAALSVLLQGFIWAATPFPTFTVGGPVYVSETAGAVTQTAPTTTDACTRVIGFAVHADKMWFAPAQTYVTHT